MEKNYERQTNQQKSMKLPKWAAILLAGSFVMNGALLIQINAAKEALNQVSGQVNGVSTNMQHSLSSHINQMNELFQQEASLISEFTYDFGQYENKQVGLTMTVKPKLFTTGDKLFFSYVQEGQPPQLVEAQPDGAGAFSAEVEVSLIGSLETDLLIENGQTRQLEGLETIYSPQELFGAQLSARPVTGRMNYDSESQALVLSFEFELLHFQNQKLGAETQLENVQLEVMVGEQVVDTIPMDQVTEAPVHEKRYWVSIQSYEIPSKVGDEVSLYITTNDQLGLNYKANVGKWKIGEESVVEDYSFAHQGMIEIY